MLWLLLVLFSAIFQATGDLFSKKILKDLNEYTVAFSKSFFSTLCLLPLLLFGFTNPDSMFWLITLLWSIMITIASILYVRAIKLSPLSVTIPMLAFSPLFLLVTSPLIVGEFPSTIGVLGILVIVIGTYFLSIRDIRSGLFAPIKALFNEKGVPLMLIVAFIFSICTNFSKISIQYSNPFFYGVVSSTFVSCLLFLVIIIRSKNSVREMRNHLKDLFPTGLFESLRFIFALVALELVLVSFVVSVARSSIIFSTLYGYLFFKEKRIKERLLGGLIIVLGVFMISFS